MSALTTETTENGVLVAAFSDGSILDEAKIQQIGKELNDLVPQAAATGRLLLDFRGVSYMSSAMLGKLIILDKKCKAADVVMKVCRVSDRIKDLFKMTKLKIDIKKDKEKAVASFDKKGWFR